MNRATRAILGIFFIFVIAISAVSITQNLGKRVRMDITERELYTLSEGTKEILTELNQPITLKLFYAKTAAMKGPDEIRYYNNYYTYVKALLEEYAIQAKGNVVLEVIDPRPYSDEEMAAIRYGLRRFNITEDESFFFGMVLQTQFGVTKTIDFFSPDRQEFVEYDISYLIDTAITRQKTRLGVLSSLSVMGDSEYMLRMMQMQGQQGQRKWGIISHLEKQFEITSVPADTDKITDVDLLLVIQPKNLPEKTLFAIDQFVLKGGRVIVCVDPHCIADMPDRQQQMQGMQHDASSNMPELLKAWGLEMPAMTFSGDRSLAVTGSPNPNRRPEKILSIMKLNSANYCFNKDNPIVADLGEVTVAFPGVLKTLEQGEDLPELKHVPLLMTSDEGNSWTIESPYELMMPNYSAFLRRFRDGTEPVVMGYMVTGSFMSAFPEGIEAPNEAADQEADENADPNAPATQTVTGLTEATESGAIVVLADVDFLSDMVAYQRTFLGLAPMGGNSTLILNALESLSGSNRLISIRSRGSYERPFTVVKDIETAAEEEMIEETRAIEAQVKGFEQQLNEKLQSLQGDNKGAIINQTILEEKKEIELQLRDAEKRLRDIKMKKRERVEGLKGWMRFYCTIPVPILTVMMSIGLGIYRSVKRRRYISHASDS